MPRLILKVDINLVKLFLLASLVLLILIPGPSYAAGLVPCGTSSTPPCTFGHLVQLFDNVIDFLLFSALVPLATLAIAFTGFQYLTAVGNPGKLDKATESLKDVLWGIFIALAAYAIIKTIFVVLTNYSDLPPITGDS